MNKPDLLDISGFFEVFHYYVNTNEKFHSKQFSFENI